ncbi:methylated-DNA--[protein]-cysteine S-methyltransferase [bacterium]|nr:methylated-DNA--[protein]-cysteine S-methyltransferase [bacterium]
MKVFTITLPFLHIMKKFFASIPDNASYCIYQTQVTPILLIACNQYLRAVLYSKNYDLEQIQIDNKLQENKSHPILSETKKQLDQYFQKNISNFDLPLYLHGSEFQKASWSILTRIDYGQTISYQEQAIRMGDIKKSRAVGMANAKNPISIIVPCHRVIAKSGSLQGYGGGLEMKKHLIELEK